MAIKNRASIIVILFLAAIVLLSGCHNQDVGNGTDGGQVVLLLLKNQSNPFFQDIAKGTQAEFANVPRGIRLEVRSGADEGDTTTQRQVLDEFYSQFVSGRSTPLLRGVILTPAASGSELTRQIKQIRDKNIPVIILDTRIENRALKEAETDYDAFIASSNRDGAASAADLIVTHLSQGGNILVLNGVEGQETARERRAGFSEEIVKKSREMNITYNIEERTANWQRAEARRTVDSFLAFGKRFDAVFGANDLMALGAVDALGGRMGGGSVVVVGFDAIPEAREAVAKGVLLATMAQNPGEMGRRGVRSLLQLWSKAPIEKDQLIPVDIVSR